MTVTKEQIAKVVQRLMQGKPSYHNVQFFEVIAAINTATGLRQAAYGTLLEETLDELESKQYLRVVQGGNRMPLLVRGLEFDQWRGESMTQNSRSGTSGTNFIFNGTVGSVQTGANSTANIVQTLGGTDKEKLIEALRALQDELTSANLPETVRIDLSEIANDSIVELNKERPNPIKLTSSLTAISQTIQTAAATLPAYQLLKIGAAHFGITLP